MKKNPGKKELFIIILQMLPAHHRLNPQPTAPLRHKSVSYCYLPLPGIVTKGQAQKHLPPHPPCWCCHQQMDKSITLAHHRLNL